MTKIYYYISPSGDNPVKNFINSLAIVPKRKIAQILAHISEYGLGTHIQNIKKLSGTNLWEIKIVSNRSIRIIYAIILKGDVLLLNGFIKKTQKTPINEINTSQKRYHEWTKSNLTK